MRHKESDLQIRCVKWFRISYPAFARLLEHPKNEGNGDRIQGAIAKAEGVVAGVADLILHVPSKSYWYKGELQEEPYTYHSLAIEMKTKTGRQSEGQKIFQMYFEAAGGMYVVVRSFEEFCDCVRKHMDFVPSEIYDSISEVHKQLELQKMDAAKRELRKIINKKSE